MITAKINDDMFTPDVIADPYAYYGRLREEDPVHWNEKYACGSSPVTMTWSGSPGTTSCSRPPCSETIPGRPIPDIDESDRGCTSTSGSTRPINSSSTTVPSISRCARWCTAISRPSRWRRGAPSSVAIKDLLDEAEAKGSMDVMRDLATPLPVLVIAQMMGVPDEDRALRPATGGKAPEHRAWGTRPYEPLTEGMQGMIDYVSPLVDERIVNPGDDFISVLAQGEKAGHLYPPSGAGEYVAAAPGRPRDDHQPAVQWHPGFHPPSRPVGNFKQDPAGRAMRATEECLRYDAPVKSIQRIASQDVEMRGKVLRQNDRIRWFISSANRDPKKFAEA